MRATVISILILLLTITAYGQQRNTSFATALPAPGSPGTVTLSLSEYNRLVELATRKPETPDTAPLPFVLSHAVFKLKLVNQTLIGTVDIDGATLTKGSIKAPLTTGLTILEARQSNNPLPLLQEGPNHAAILSGPGPFAVSLGIASGLTIDAGRAAFTLPVPLASSSLLRLELPGNHANVHVEPGIVTSRTTENGNTIVEATLEPGKAARVWWTTREVAAPVAQREVRFLSDVKTVVSVGDSQLRLTALCDVTVIQGEAAEFTVPMPAGFELTAASGTTLESADAANGTLTLRVHEPNQRNHQFLIAFERTNGDTKVETPFLTFTGAQRETGELLVEGVGAMELVARESGALRRMDVREAGAVTRSLSHFPLQAAFRYNRRAADAPKLQLEWTQFPDANVLSAVAERAVVTTLANVEGRALTEVTLRVRNHAQPFMKVELPAGAQMLSTEVEGQSVKPMKDGDGSRVPLLRAGLDSSRAYTVSFVYLNTGSAFAKTGSYDIALPRVDIPINVLTWELSLPDRLEVKQFSGNAFAAELLPGAAQEILAALDDVSDEDTLAHVQYEIDLGNIQPGQIGGIVVDKMGAVIPNASVTVVNKQTGTSLSTKSDSEGRWLIPNAPPGPTRVQVESQGFKTTQFEMNLVALQPGVVSIPLEVGTVSESVTVQSGRGNTFLVDGVDKLEEQARKNRALQLSTASQNVTNLQRRVAGILPVRIEVPRSGRSYRFVRPLVLDEETKIAFQYKLR
ncbi:MAG TPA: carboxypeptidase-like regulatory domain-containing protein [Pyrinomonadaceae bacterium]|nr:carboxypeptidase-like regulatory domain-containing protein [Pyrinomonadaceae bacterium]